jgi:hypothetical protein
MLDSELGIKLKELIGFDDNEELSKIKAHIEINQIKSIEIGRNSAEFSTSLIKCINTVGSRLSHGSIWRDFKITDINNHISYLSYSVGLKLRNNPVIPLCAIAPWDSCNIDPDKRSYY